MTHHIRFTEEARADLKRLYAFAQESSEGDWRYAGRIIDAVEAGMVLLASTPFAGRRAADDPLQRELVIGFGNAGFVALYEIEDGQVITVLAVRHQREDDYR